MIPYPPYISQKPPNPPSMPGNGLVSDPTKHRLYNLFKSKQFTDYSIFFQDQEYPVHKCILASSCPYFASCLASEDSNGSTWKENTASIAMQFEFEVPKEAFEHFLIYLYTDKIPEVAMEEYAMLFYEFGDFFVIPALSKASLPYVSKLLTIEAYHHVIPWMELKDNEEFDVVIMAFIRQHRDALFANGFHLQQLNERILWKLIGWQPQSFPKSSAGKSLGERIRDLREKERLRLQELTASRSDLLTEIRHFNQHDD